LPLETSEACLPIDSKYIYMAARADAVGVHGIVEVEAGEFTDGAE